MYKGMRVLYRRQGKIWEGVIEYSGNGYAGMRASVRVIGRLSHLIGEHQERAVPSLSRAEWLRVAATGNRAVSAHAKQFLGSGNSRCVWISQDRKVNQDVDE